MACGGDPALGTQAPEELARWNTRRAWACAGLSLKSPPPWGTKVTVMAWRVRAPALTVAPWMTEELTRLT